MKHNSPQRSAGFPVMARSCETCIFRKDLHWDLDHLLAEIRDPHAEGHFSSYRACHHKGAGQDVAACRGFWNRYKDDFDLGQLAQRLGLVIEVEPTGLIQTREQKSNDNESLQGE